MNHEVIKSRNVNLDILKKYFEFSEVLHFWSLKENFEIYMAHN